MSTSRHLFVRDLLSALAVPGTLENTVALIAQCQAEGSPETSKGGGARFNPLNCTVRAEGSSDYNPPPIHVQNYATYAQGIAITKQMLEQDNFKPLLAALKKGNSAVNYWVALDRSGWGSHPPHGYTIASWLDDCRAHWMTRAMERIAGT